MPSRFFSDVTAELSVDSCMTSDAPISLSEKLSVRKGFWIAVPIVVIIDQFAKSIAGFFLKPDGWQPGDEVPVYRWIEGVVHGTWAHGGFLPNEEPVTWYGIAIAALFWGALFYYAAFRSKPREGLIRVGAGLAVGGALSNLVDLAVFGGARNFFMVAARTFSTAAIAMVVGFLLLIVGAFVARRKHPAPPAPPPPKPRANTKRPYGLQPRP
jgi:lipoprotein signal peptidase